MTVKALFDLRKVWVEGGKLLCLSEC